MSGAVTTPPWRYDPGETPKKKHGWSRREAGFVRRGDVLVGKCPKGVPIQEAARALQGGIPVMSPRSPGTHPRRIYVVHGGVLYRAVPTVAGVSYHGFPELPAEFQKLDEETREKIWAMARAGHQEDELRRWLKQTW